MSYQPIVPTGGLIGWGYLSRTLETQTGNFAKNPEIVRDTEYFTQNINSVRSAEGLVSDRRLMRVALGAFGLQSDIDSRAFIQKVLEGGTEEPTALANRLSDDRYAEFARAFGFGNPGGARTASPTWAQSIVSKFQRQQFEVAVGNQDESMRLAMDAQRTMPEIGALSGTDETKWFKIMASPPLRQVFETALGLPAAFGQADLDIQVTEFADRAQRQLGIDDLSKLSDPEVQDAVIRRFLLRDQVASFSQQSSGAIALTLLQSMPRLY
ncbi:Protein of unknown function [Roseovarius nanhaiticus]|uniref:Flagellar protein n=2 Tax=Roseovarius nanhaiticus TaxID=573024 RepID=A0A1N7HLE1_9RHOB|nr:DUF1217 domain-containing protein [Roseovarius nanhaiticus]SEL26615.1 Protein of unknown function [Roseovarius nanhaiticus]SIS25490.1 Protein of unknown function [Roseovarius nanhaiticus]